MAKTKTKKQKGNKKRKQKKKLHVSVRDDECHFEERKEGRKDDGCCVVSSAVVKIQRSN